MRPIAEELVAETATLPVAAETGPASLAFERWEDAAAAADPAVAAHARAIAADPDGRRLLRAVFAHSPFLTACMTRDLGFACRLLAEGPASAWDGAVAALDGIPPGEARTEEMAAALRIARRRTALATGIADISGAWPVARVCEALTDFAERALGLAARHLLAKGAVAGELELAAADTPERDSGWIILGMGKLGGRELNYSSDIDLIVLYDNERLRYTGKSSVQRCLVRMTQELVRLMSERTADGYVFRTDLRLRPDPGSTPIALSALAAEAYYESTGQNWERAAMIKARPVAGDLAAGESFIRLLRPFIWRKNLDFAQIADIHSIKRQIYAQRGGSTIAVAGHNIKLGRGGIREIEFFAQTQQLIWGGREPSLRPRATCDALRALAAAGRLDPAVAERLIGAYWFLRRLENRLQMVDDQQTHSLPRTADEVDSIGRFMGYSDRAAFETALVAELRAVESHYALLFEESPALSGPGNLVFTGADDDPDTLETLAGLGFRDPSMVAGRIRVWHHGRYRAMRSARARELLTELVPAILEALSKTIDPDAALLKLDDFLRALPAGVLILSLLTSNPRLLELIAQVMGSAPRLADALSRQPILLDGMLSPDFFDRPPDAARLAEDLEIDLAQARDFEDVLDLTRRWTADRIFQIGAQILLERIAAEEAGPLLSDVAEVTVRSILPRTAAEFARAHGSVPGGAFAVVAFGKLGGRELTVESDLDLLFLYDVADDHAQSDGERPLPSLTYYARLCQRFLSAMSAPTAEGRLYEIDMRLRPTGASGPIATSFEAFVRYQGQDAWTWEHLALTRARVIAAPAPFAARIESAIRAALTRPRDPDGLVRDVADMRARMAREHRTDDWWRIKHFRGGLIDIEFIAQYLQLRHAHAHPEVLATNTTEALERLAAAGAIDPQVAGDLAEAMHLWRKLQGIVRLAFGPSAGGAEISEAHRRFVARALGAVDFADLEQKSLAVAARAHAHFVEIVERPAAAAAASGESGAEEDGK